jgi:hypothetical protein
MTECHFLDQSLTIAFLIVPLDDSLEFFVKVAIYESLLFHIQDCQI